MGTSSLTIAECLDRPSRPPFSQLEPSLPPCPRFLSATFTCHDTISSVPQPPRQALRASVPCSHVLMPVAPFLPQLPPLLPLPGRRPTFPGLFPVPSSLPLWPLSEGKLHTPALTQSCPRSPPAETPTFLAHHRMAGLSDNWGLQRPSLPPAPGHSLQALWVGVPQASRLWPPPHIRTEGQSPPLTCVSPVSGSARGR